MSSCVGWLPALNDYLGINPKYGSLTVKCRRPSPKRPVLPSGSTSQNCTPADRFKFDSSPIEPILGLVIPIHLKGTKSAYAKSILRKEPGLTVPAHTKPVKPNQCQPSHLGLLS
ncbi:hypothetical protein PIB30_025642 [Stylosanthes scabra]|uniref:Uncharacterized protein n=1 Tax=Stylosanthes scabra TaxID=79078 RepID=A0ABU6UDF4_9FABA|nr:hypothetical protein [Stylosanthes scabra]